jgi:hypothetical protein
VADRRDIVVDGANVAFEELTKDGKPKVSNLVAVRRALEDRGFDPIIFVDASLRHEIDDPRQLESLIDRQIVRQVPAGTDADYFVLMTAEQQHAQVVSNDRYGPYHDEFPWIDKRRVPVMIVEGQVQLYEPKLEEAW